MAQVRLMQRLKNQSALTQTLDVGGENGAVWLDEPVLDVSEGWDLLGWLEDCLVDICEIKN
jgi:hypothetical protein